MSEIKSVSVITPSIRPAGLEIVAKALSTQTLRPLEWLICGPKKNRKIVNETIRNIFPFKYLGNLPLKKGMFWDLNYSYNKLFKNVHGKTIVTWQDWIWTPPDALQSFVDSIEKTNGGIIGGVGDQYEQLNKFDRPEVKIWSDPRKTDKYGNFYESCPSDIEWNFAAFTKNAIFDVGGCCEKLDWTGYGMDGYQVNERWNILGYKFYLDQTNISYTLRHNRDSYGGEEKWNKNNNLTNGQYEKVRQEFIEKKEWPRMKYLK